MSGVGLDPEPTRFWGSLKGDANKIYDFFAAIVDTTADLVSVFKPKIAYFAAHRADSAPQPLRLSAAPTKSRCAVKRAG